MTSMTSPTTRVVIGGVDTHGHTHHAAVIDDVGRQLGDREFTATPAGYRALADWLGGYGTLTTIGVEGTGAYGAGLARYLATIRLTVVEVDRPDRKSRRAHGKSDPLDAYAAARAVLSGSAAGVPKLRDGRVEAIRALRVARSSAVKARSQATNQIKALIISGPSELREQLRHLPTAKIIASCARLRPGHHLGDPVQATKTALRRLARRHQQLTEEIADADHDIAQLVADAAPELLSIPGVGPEVAGQLLTSAGDNPDRITSEAAFAHLCGAAPIPASSGRVHRHRLNRGGDRHANNALYIVVLNRLRYDPRSRAYAERRTQEGLSKPEIIRCLKRYVAREIYRVLVPAPAAETWSAQPLDNA
jgi:transposase